MKRFRTYALAALLFATSAGAASAQPGGWGFILSAMQRAQAARLANQASVDQTGRNNGAAIGQQGRANLAALQQRGNTNAGTVTQSGDNNAAMLRQVGRNNSGGIAQTGDNNTACLIQVGRNLDGTLVQTGDDNSLGVIQTRRGVREIDPSRCAQRTTEERFIRGVGLGRF